MTNLFKILKEIVRLAVFLICGVAIFLASYSLVQDLINKFFNYFLGL